MSTFLLVLAFACFCVWRINAYGKTMTTEARDEISRELFPEPEPGNNGPMWTGN